MTEAPQFTPVILLTGFLGSGKTTLLQRMLGDPALANTAVLINEFGEVALDHHLLGRIDERTVVLKSGCVCCTVRGELADALRDLHSRRARGNVPMFDRVIIESTGLADPFPVLTTLHGDPMLKHHFRMAEIVTTVDAVNGTHTLANHDESVKQVAVADKIVLTKTDIARPAAIASIERRVRAINPSATLLRDEPLRFFEDVAHRRDPVTAAWFAEELHAPTRDHASDVSAFAVVTSQQLDWTMFSIWLTMLLHRHGDRVLRVKGILDVAGSESPVAIHGVQHLVHPPIHMAAWPDTDKRSRIVFIVRGMDTGEIQRSFGTFCGGAKPALGSLPLAPADASAASVRTSPA